MGGLVHWQLNAVHRLQQVSYLLLFCRWTVFNSQHSYMAIDKFGIYRGCGDYAHRDLSGVDKDGNTEAKAERPAALTVLHFSRKAENN